MKILGVVIAGGQSQRMGGVEKALMSCGGKTILAHVLEHLNDQVAEVVINANGDHARFSAHSQTIIPDLLGDVRTPLAGLHAGLHHAATSGFDGIITVPSDGPFLPLDLAAKLAGAAGARGAAIALSNGQPHYLTGFWHCRLLPSLNVNLVRSSLRRVQDWAVLVNAAHVEWSVEPFDPFFNINTAEDLAIAETYLQI